MLSSMEPGIPTDAYDIAQAVSDGILVPLRSVNAPRHSQLG
jgi:type I site-specific restriction endonuclease